MDLGIGFRTRGQESSPSEPSGWSCSAFLPFSLPSHPEPLMFSSPATHDSFIFKSRYYCMCMAIRCMHVCTAHVCLGPTETRDYAGHSGVGITMWMPRTEPGSSEEQLVVLLAAEPSLQLSSFLIKCTGVHLCRAWQTTVTPSSRPTSELTLAVAHSRVSTHTVTQVFH